MANINLAFSEDAIQHVFNTVRDSIYITKSGSSTGRFRASYNVGVRLAGGDIDLKGSPPRDEVKISELDIVYDPLNITLEVDIPEVCVGGFCIIRLPFRGCVLRAPRICLFSSNPDISIPINLNGLIQSEISGAFDIEPRFYDNPLSAGLNSYQAYAANASDEWQFFLKALWLDLDIIDISDTVGNILDSIINNFINGIFGGLPSWARSVLSWLLHGISDIIRGILDIGDDIDEWLSDLLGISFGLFDYIIDEVSNYFLNVTPLYKIPTPYPILQANPPFIPFPVLLPINSVSRDITDDEFIINIDV